MLASAAMAAVAGCSGKDARGPRAGGAQDTAVAAELRQAADTAAFSEAADVAMRDIPDSTLPMPPRRTMVTHGARPMRMAPASDVRPSLPAPVAPVRREPVRVAPSPRPGSDATDPMPACASSAMADQRRCLMAYLGQSDVGLDRVYQARIRALRAEAGTPAGAPDPDSVQRLRIAQRAWLVYRDTECRNRNQGREGALWAPVRAQCLGEFSQARAAELAR